MARHPVQKIADRVRVRVYEVVCRAVEEGIRLGITRAHKHTDEPSRDAIQENIEREVMTSLCEVLAFEEVADG